MKRAIAAALSAISLATASKALAADDMSNAMNFYERGDYLLARDHLRTAARGGDARAAEILGFMYAFGSEMYPGMGRDLSAAAYWFDMAARGGRPLSRYMSCALQRKEKVPARTAHCFDRVADAGTPGPR